MTLDPRANDLFLEALGLPTANERRAFLDRACAGDAALRAAVEWLLETSARTGAYPELPTEGAASTNTSIQWGLPGDVPAPGDYDGDGIVDQAIYRPSASAWYATASSLGGGAFFVVAMSAVAPAIPVPGDYDGDGRTDPAVYETSGGAWKVRTSTTGYTTRS